MKKKFIALFLLFSSPLAYSEPSNTVSYLIKEPVSLWDFGIYQLGNSLKDLTILPSRLTFFATPIYVPEINRLRIIAYPPMNFKVSPADSLKAKTKDEAKRFCKDMVNTMRWRFNVNANTGSTSPMDSSNICHMFKHDSYKSTIEPINICSEIDSMITLMAHSTTIDGNTINCEGPLVSNRIYYSE